MCKARPARSLRENNRRVTAELYMVARCPHSALRCRFTEAKYEERSAKTTRKTCRASQFALRTSLSVPLAYPNHAVAPRVRQKRFRLKAFRGRKRYREKRLIRHF